MRDGVSDGGYAVGVAIGGRGQARPYSERKCPGSLRRWGPEVPSLPGPPQEQGEGQGVSDCWWKLGAPG